MKKLITVFALTVMLLCSCGNGQNGAGQEHTEGYRLEFSKFGYDSGIVHCKNPGWLQTKIDVDAWLNPVYVFYDPVEKADEVAEQFGFAGCEYETFRENGRIYRSDDATLTVDKYGCFHYSLLKAGSQYEMTLSPSKCRNIAKKYLKEKGFWPATTRYHGYSTEYNTVGGVTTKTGISVSFKIKKFEGREISGYPWIHTDVNADGNLKFLDLVWREYRSKEKAELISVAEALEKIREGDARFSVGLPPARLDIKNVSICYYNEGDMFSDTIMLQPVYVFTGTSTTVAGEKERFSITVQANRVTG